MKFKLLFLLCALAGLGWGVTSVGRALAAQAQPQAESPLPLMFIENVGQFADGVRYQVWGAPGTIVLTDRAVWLLLSDAQHERQAAIRIAFPGASDAVRIQPFGPLDVAVNYFLGNRPEHWFTRVPVYAGVRYQGLYPGMDLEIRGDQGRWQWRWVPDRSLVGRMTARRSLPMSIEGAQQVEAAAGGLYLTTALGRVFLPLPTGATVDVRRPDGTSVQVGASTAQRDAPGRASQLQGVQTNPSDLLFSSFLGGSQDDVINGMTLDSSGNMYLTGYTVSPDLPATTGTYNGGASDAFVALVKAGGTQMDYLTFLGGNGGDTGTDIALFAGVASVTGWTNSTDFPTTSDALQATLRGAQDAFLSRLDVTGVLVYSSLLGGTGNEYGNAIAVDSQGDMYLAGWTTSDDFPVITGTFQTTHQGSEDAYVVKMDLVTTTLTSTVWMAYAGYLGSASTDIGTAIAVDGSGAAYVGGYTISAAFPVTPGAYDTSFGGFGEGFVAKISPDGSQIVYATFLGGGQSWDEVDALTVDSSGAVYAVGWTDSGDFPTTAGAWDTTYNGGDDIFVTRLTPAGDGALYSTFIGGSGNDQATAVVVDADGQAYLTGWTDSTDFPYDMGAFDATPNGQEDGILVRLNASGSRLTYVTYLGGSALDEGRDVAVDDSGAVYVVGRTQSSDFPTANALYSSYNGNSDAFFLKLGMQLKYTNFLPLVLR